MAACRRAAVTNDNADKMPRSAANAKNTGPHPTLSRKAGERKVGAGTCRYYEGLAASIAMLRAEEPRARITDHVAPLIEQRTARPIAARTPDRIRRCIRRIGNVTRLYRISGICRVRNCAADDGASCKSAHNA